jgi:D-arabinose 5-phosphate isomerase GutQ
LAALRYAKAQRQDILAVVNQPESSIAREADIVLPTRDRRRLDQGLHHPARRARRIRGGGGAGSAASSARSARPSSSAI